MPSLCSQRRGFDLLLGQTGVVGAIGAAEDVDGDFHDWARWLLLPHIVPSAPWFDKLTMRATGEVAPVFTSCVALVLRQAQDEGNCDGALVNGSTSSPFDKLRMRAIVTARFSQWFDELTLRQAQDEGNCDGALVTTVRRTHPSTSSPFDELTLRQAHPSTSSPFDKLTLRQAQGEGNGGGACRSASVALMVSLSNHEGAWRLASPAAIA